MSIRIAIPITILLTLAGFNAGCNSEDFYVADNGSKIKITAEQRKAASEAITALRKVQASVELESDLKVFDESLIEAKARVNQVTVTLPEGELRSNLEKSIEQFTFGAAFIRLGSAANKSSKIQPDAKEDSNYGTGVLFLDFAAKSLAKTQK